MYATKRCPSVRLLSVRLCVRRVCCCGPGGREIIDQQRRAPSNSGAQQQMQAVSSLWSAQEAKHRVAYLASVRYLSCTLSVAPPHYSIDCCVIKLTSSVTPSLFNSRLKPTLSTNTSYHRLYFSSGLTPQTPTSTVSSQHIRFFGYQFFHFTPAHDNITVCHIISS